MGRLPAPPAYAPFQQVHSKRIDRCALARTRNTGDPHTDSLSCIGQTLLDNGLSHFTMSRQRALHQSYSLTKNHTVARQNFFHVLIHIAMAAFLPLF